MPIGDWIFLKIPWWGILFVCVCSFLLGCPAGFVVRFTIVISAVGLWITPFTGRNQPTYGEHHPFTSSTSRLIPVDMGIFENSRSVVLFATGRFVFGKVGILWPTHTLLSVWSKSNTRWWIWCHGFWKTNIRSTIPEANGSPLKSNEFPFGMANFQGIC